MLVFFNSSKKNACCAGPGQPQEREMKTPGLDLSLPISSPLFVQAFLLFTAGLFISLILLTPSASSIPCHIGKSLRGTWAQQNRIFFFSVPTRLWTLLDWLGREAKWCLHPHHCSPWRSYRQDRDSSTKPLRCSFFFLYMTFMKSN